jgi:hypothetical protein
MCKWLIVGRGESVLWVRGYSYQRLSEIGRIIGDGGRVMMRHRLYNCCVYG